MSCYVHGSCYRKGEYTLFIGRPFKVKKRPCSIERAFRSVVVSADAVQLDLKDGEALRKVLVIKGHVALILRRGQLSLAMSYIAVKEAHRPDRQSVPPCPRNSRPIDRIIGARFGGTIWAAHLKPGWTFQ